VRGAVFPGLLVTPDPSIRLVQPDVQRDALLSLQWLDGEHGRATMLLMGVPAGLIEPPTLDREKARVSGFISRDDQYNWMIERHDRVIGSIWADLRPAAVLGAPAVSLMVGDLAARHLGTGRHALIAVVQFLLGHGASEVFARALVSNDASAGLLTRVGFARLGDPYVDPGDRLRWQNFVIRRPL
jgi:RimJ/RimL family protein N-acetyltransferase